MEELTQRHTTRREKGGDVDVHRQWRRALARGDMSMVVHSAAHGAGWRRCSEGGQANLDQKQRRSTLELVIPINLLEVLLHTERGATDNNTKNID